MNKKTEYFIKLILYFFIFSLIGWILETAFCYFVLGHFVKRGFLFGPLCPIYGFGALILILFLKKYQKQTFKLFFVSAIVCSAFEYLVSFGLEAIFSIKWWDYSPEFLNLNGRIGAFYAFAWGIIAILFTNHIFPFFEKIITAILSKLNSTSQKILASIICLSVLTDMIASSIKYLL